MEQTYPFKVLPLPYDYDALEPQLGEKTLCIHHDRLYRTYVNRLNSLLVDHERFHNCTLTTLLLNPQLLPPGIRTDVMNNAGGVYNHQLYFFNMGKKTIPFPYGCLAQDLYATFGSFIDFKRVFKENALAVFGSGYAWLVADLSGKLCVVKTKNQDVVPLDRQAPLLVIDVWEHAYYLEYQNKREDYIENFFRLIDWNIVEQRYEQYLTKRRLIPSQR
jgi:Fe-Mn family superoxide dismutase